MARPTPTRWAFALAAPLWLAAAPPAACSTVQVAGPREPALQEPALQEPELQEPAPPVEAPAPAPRVASGEVAAQAGETVVTFSALESLLIERYGAGEEGRRSIAFLAQGALLEALAEERDVTVTGADLDRRLAELDAQFRENGVEGGIAGELARTGVTERTFRDTLRLAIVQERLTRQALELPAGAPVTGDQQQLWMDQELAQRGIEHAPWPWEGGVVAHVGGTLPIGTDELSRALREQLPVETVREACLQLALLERVEQRMPDLTELSYAEAVADEVERRRGEAESDPRYQGVAFEELLRAQGLSVERLGRDPAVRVSALAHKFVDEKYGEQGLRDVYAEERQFFEDEHGAAIRARMLFLLATDEPHPLLPRTYEEAEETLRELVERAPTEAAFGQLCKLHSEDPLSRQRGGDLGFVTRGDERVPQPLRDVLFELAGSGELADPPSPPQRVENGVAVLWISERRPSPDWEGMRPHVHRELRRRFLRSTLAPEDLVTYLDRPETRSPAPPEEPTPEPGG